MTINLPAIQKSATASMVSGLKNRELFKAAFGEICASGTADDFKSARIAWTNHAYKVMTEKVGDKADTEYARTLFYRELKNAGLAAPGKNAGSRQSTQETAVLDYSEQALVTAYRASDWNLCRRIITAAEKSVAVKAAAPDATAPVSPELGDGAGHIVAPETVLENVA